MGILRDPFYFEYVVGIWWWGWWLVVGEEGLQYFAARKCSKFRIFRTPISLFFTRIPLLSTPSIFNYLLNSSSSFLFSSSLNILKSSFWSGERILDERKGVSYGRGPPDSSLWKSFLSSFFLSYIIILSIPRSLLSANWTKKFLLSFLSSFQDKIPEA